MFDRKATGDVSGPNKSVVPADFPFHKLANVKNRESAVLFDTNDVFSSSGTFAGDFVSSKSPAQTPTATSPLLAGVLTALSINLKQTTRFDSEVCQLTYDPLNKAAGYWVSLPCQWPDLSQGRTAPDADHGQRGLQHRQFWDGRANNEFNGWEPVRSARLRSRVHGRWCEVRQPQRCGTGILQIAAGTQAGVKIIQPLIKNASLASRLSVAALGLRDVLLEKDVRRSRPQAHSAEASRSAERA